jgi:hypothetical protein
MKIACESISATHCDDLRRGLCVSLMFSLKVLMHIDLLPFLISQQMVHEFSSNVTCSDLALRCSGMKQMRFPLYYPSCK